jgi:hypothetical protein
MHKSATIHWSGAMSVGIVTGLAVAVAIMTAAAAVQATLPLVCNKGPDGQRFNVGVTLPGSVEAGSVYTIRLDGHSSGKIDHFGLNHIHDMTVEYALPAETTYVEGSAKLVAGTGTPNVRVGSKLWHRAGVVTMQLPGKVENGTGYTPPSITLDVRAGGAPGSWAVLGFRHFQLKANAFLVGDVAVSCDPTPRPYPIGATLITKGTAAVPVR